MEHPSPVALAVGLIASVLDGRADAISENGSAILGAMAGLDPSGRARFTGAVTTAAASIAAEAIKNLPDGREWFQELALKLAAEGTWAATTTGVTSPVLGDSRPAMGTSTVDGPAGPLSRSALCYPSPDLRAEYASFPIYPKTTSAAGRRCPPGRGPGAPRRRGKGRESG